MKIKDDLFIVKPGIFGKKYKASEIELIRFNKNREDQLVLRNGRTVDFRNRYVEKDSIFKFIFSNYISFEREYDYEGMELYTENEAIDITRAGIQEFIDYATDPKWCMYCDYDLKEAEYYL